MKSKKIVATIEARMMSSRLPGKVLMNYCGKPNLWHIVKRLERSQYIDQVVVATTIHEQDQPIVEFCEQNGIAYYRGSEEDVLLRVLDAAKSVDADVIVEITGDCPVIDWRHINRVIEKYQNSECDYCSNIMERTFPRGFDVQVFSVDVLERVNTMTKSPVDHEHVSLFIYTNPDIFRCVNVSADKNEHYPEYGITLDTPEDYALINEIYSELYPQNNDFSAIDVIEFILSTDQLKERALDLKRKNPFKDQLDWIEKYGRT